jgi:hypothetical protein
MGSMSDAMHGNDTVLLIYLEHDAVVTPTGGPVTRQLVDEWFAQPHWIVEHGGGDELNDGWCDSRR